jgi:hypothetical protein
MSPDHFPLVILDIGPHFLPRLTRTVILLFTLPAIAGMTGAHHHPQLFSFEMGSGKFFAQAGLEL